MRNWLTSGAPPQHSRRIDHSVDVTHGPLASDRVKFVIVRIGIDLARFKAAHDQIKAVIRARPSGNGGTICPPKAVRDGIYYYQGNSSCRWLRQLIHTLRYGCD
jgi:hypothetical protein